MKQYTLNTLILLLLSNTYAHFCIGMELLPRDLVKQILFLSLTSNKDHFAESPRHVTLSVVPQVCKQWHNIFDALYDSVIKKNANQTQENPACFAASIGTAHAAHWLETHLATVKNFANAEELFKFLEDFCKILDTKGFWKHNTFEPMTNMLDVNRLRPATRAVMHQFLANEGTYSQYQPAGSFRPIKTYNENLTDLAGPYW